MLTAADLKNAAELRAIRWPHTRRTEIRRSWMKEFGRVCPVPGCSTSMTFERVKGQMAAQATIDHIICRALGGGENFENLTVVCWACNHRKSQIEHELVEARRRARIIRVDEETGEVEVRPALHFIGFRGDEFWSAVKVWGRPEFIHRGWDRRAFRDIHPQDTVVFARGDEHQPPRHQNFSDIAE